MTNEYINFGGHRYRGNLKEGAPHGFGQMLWADGCVYEGDWNMGRPALQEVKQLCPPRGVWRYALKQKAQYGHNTEEIVRSDWKWFVPFWVLLDRGNNRSSAKSAIPETTMVSANVAHGV